jgi:hypothetical protein
MKKLLWPIVVLLVAGAALHAASNKVVLEAESALSIVPSMVKGTDAGASKGAYLGIPLARPHATTEGAPKDQGRATYKVKIPNAGTWRFWARTKWTDGCGNSFFLKIGSKPQVDLGQDGTYGSWHWVKGPSLSLPAGVVNVTIQNREDGSKIDQFILTKDTRYVPVRIEK